MDRLSELEVFLAIVEQGGFTEAAKSLGMSKSAVSKHLTSLEGRLGVALLNRTTRQVSPTDIGRDYYSDARKIVSDWKNAQEMVQAMQSKPMGELHVSVATDFGSNQIAPILVKFFETFRDVTIRLSLTNRYVDLVEEGIDLAIRIGVLEDSSLKARKLATTRSRIVGSPSYFELHGRPQKLEDLAEHRLLQYSPNRQDAIWPLVDVDGNRHAIRARANLIADDGQSLLSAAEGGIGLAFLPSFLCGAAIKDGRLETLFDDVINREAGIYAVYPDNHFMQPKLRAFIDFLVEEFKGAEGRLW